MSLPDHRPAVPVDAAAAADSSAEAASANALDSGLTEIALALAMAFFSIMVLAMISLSVPPLPDGRAAADGSAAPNLVVAASTDSPAAATAPATRRRLVVLHEGRFLDADLVPRDPASIDGPAILAIAPGQTLEQAIAARRKLAATTDVIVSTLDGRWLDRLAALSMEEGE